MLTLQMVAPFAQEAGGPAGNEPDPRLLESLRTITRETLNFAEAVRPTIDRAAFEQGALLDRLEYDDAQLVRFVTDKIAYEAYPGLLRGAHGTLLARAGNALDQSLLLATLLNDAGFDAVIRSGTLAPSEASRLIRGVARRPSVPKAWDEAAFAKALEHYREQLKDIPPLESVGIIAETGDSRNALVAGILQDSKDLLSALGQADIRLGNESASDEVLREASEYFWVEYRNGPATPWQPVHVAFGGEPPPEVDIAETYAREIPPERMHRLRLELFVDQRVGDDVRTTPLMSAMEFPSANVSGQTISLMLLPDTLMRQESFADNISPAAEARFLVPLINQGLPGGAQALALNGTTVPPELIQLSPTGVFETVGSQFESAAAALRGLDGAEHTTEPLLAIESVRLQLTLLHPLSGSRTIERFLYKSPGEALLEANADETARRVALVSELAYSHSLGFVAGSLTEGYVIDEELADGLRKAPLIRALLDPAVSECDSLACLPRPKMEVDPSGDNLIVHLAAFDRVMPTEQGSVVYRDAPNVVRVTGPLLPSSFMPNVFDIMANSRRAFRIEGGAPVPASDLVLTAGVAETHIEATIAGVWGPGPRIGNTTAGQGSSLRAWKEMPPLSHEAAVEREMVTQALSKKAVIVTASPLDEGNDALLSWWEVDTRTGRTLGMTRYGGSVMTEFIIPGTITISVATVLGVSAACFLTTFEIKRPGPFTGFPNLVKTKLFRPPKMTTNVSGCAFCMATGVVRGISGERQDQAFDQYYKACMAK
jgi:hypothetical protein